MAVLKSPVMFEANASRPKALLLSPSVFAKSASAPLAVLSLPVVLLKSAATPISRIVVCGVGKEGPSAHSGIEAASCDAAKRKPANCCIEPAPVAEAQKGHFGPLQ